MKFELVNTGGTKGWGWQLVGVAGQVVAASTGHKGEGQARRAMKAFRDAVKVAPTVVVNTPKESV